jgi:hypothetical protein
MSFLTGSLLRNASGCFNREQSWRSYASSTEPFKEADIKVIANTGNAVEGNYILDSLPPPAAGSGSDRPEPRKTPLGRGFPPSAMAMRAGANGNRLCKCRPKLASIAASDTA